MKQLYQRTLLALLALMPTALWAQTFTVDNLSYTVTGAETVSVSKTADLTGDVYIPSSVVYEDVTYAVTTIPEYAFGNTAITSVTIPASVVSVGARAFQVCNSLTSIVIEDSETPLQWLGGGSMPLFNMSQSSSYDVYLGRDLVVEDYRCYFPYATSVTIGNQVTTINDCLFQNAAKLGSVTIGNGVTSIGAYAFQGTGTAVETQYISMGNNVTTIGAYAFQGTGTAVETQYISMGNNVTTIGTYAFQGCSKLTEITLPDVLTAIPEYAFGNTGLTSITIPASVVSVGARAFQVCNSLSSITIADGETKLQWLGGTYMPLCNMANTSSYDVYLGRDLEVSGVRCYFPYATSVTIGDKVTAINSQLFQSATKLESVTLGSGVTAIGSYAFNDCSLLSSVDFTNATKLASIQERAFNNCDAITNITIPASVTTIESSAFWNMDADITVTIEDGETPLTLNCGGTYYPIFEWNNTVTAYVGRNIVRTGNYANRPTFDNSLVSLTFGPKVTAIGDNEYLDCSNLEGPVYGLANVESIGVKAFKNCQKITAIELGTKLATLGEYAFQDCQLLGSIALPGTLKKIPTEAFGNCFALGTVTLGEGIEEIGNGAFYNTDALTEITIPASVKKIGRAPFYCKNAQAMTRMIIADSDTPLEFANVTSGYNYGLANLNDDVTLDYFYLGRDINRASTQHSLLYNCKDIEIGPKVTNIDQLFYNTGDGSAHVENVKVHGLTPIAISTDPFHSNTYANATLWVPGGTKAAYQAADFWKNFTNIQTWSFVLNYTVNGHGTMEIDGVVAANGETKTVRKPNGDGLVPSNWTWTVTPDAGYELTSLTVEDKTEATDPAVQEIFVGNEGWENPHTEGTAINHDLDYVATFAPITYAITYDLAGGTVATANPATYNVESAAITLVNPTREGYTFAGWTGTALDGPAVEVSIPAGSTGGRTYTATWTPITYTISYDLAGGSVAGNLPASYTIESAAITLVNPTRTGYTFKGWKQDGAGEAQMAVTIAAGSTGNKAYTATWQINQYTITFDSNGGSEVDAITQDYNTAVTPPAAPTKTGYTFAGWNQAVPTTIPAENVTLIAQWTINQYTITFNTGGGSEVAAITQDYNTAVTAPAAPTKTGYTFAGWTPDVPSTIPAENMTLTAQWQINHYTITFDTDGGSAVPSITQDYNTAVTAPAAPTKTGYTFAGWTPAVPTTIPAEDITVKAQWTINTYSVSITGAGV
ncbi:MAG: leucine-rich repeat protein, partial [Prevotella sp.]|nr:leucine-rich repeat protein [Prevotella sp.]